MEIVQIVYFIPRLCYTIRVIVSFILLVDTSEVCIMTGIPLLIVFCLAII